MLAIILWLVSTAFTLDSVPIIYNDPPITTPTMSPVTHVLNIYTGPDPFICIYFQPQSPSIAFAYVQVTYNISPTTVTNYSNMGSMYFDPHGYSMMKDQLIVMHPTVTQANMSVTIFLTDYDSSAPLNLAYNLVVNTSATAVCPRNCSSKGTCSAQGDCQCASGFYGYDCSVSPKNLEAGKSIDHDIAFKEYLYVRIPAASLSSKINFKATKSNGDCSVNLYFRLESTASELPIPFGNAKQLSNDEVTYVTYFNQYSNSMWILLLNYGPETCHVTLSLTQQTSLGVLMVVIIVVGVAILVAMIIGVIFIIKRRRQMTRVEPEPRHRSQTVSTTLKPDEIDRYFPMVEASVLGVKPPIKGDQSNDLLPSKDCVICLCAIQATDKVRITYCNHIFHNQCLTGWFQKTENCPYCRENFDRSHTKQLYDQVYKNYKKRSSPAAQDRLEGESLAVQVSQYQKSKPLLIEQRQTVDKNDSTLATFEEDF